MQDCSRMYLFAGDARVKLEVRHKKYCRIKLNAENAMEKHLDP